MTAIDGRAAIIVALVGVGLLAGCLGAPAETTPARTTALPETTATATPTDHAPDASEKQDTTTQRPDETTARPEPPESGQGVGLAPAITTNATLEADDVTYYPANETIRYVAAYRHTNHEAVANGSEPPEREPVYEYVPVDQWLEVEAAHAGADAVKTTVSERLPSAGEDLSFGVGSGNNGTYVLAATSTTLDGDGTVVSRAAVPFDRLRNATPRAVTVTVSLENHSTTETYRVAARHMIVQYE